MSSPTEPQKKLTIIEDEAGADTVRVCITYRVQPNDLEGECDQCHRPIFYQPHPPYLCRMLCLDCAKPLLERPDAELCGPKEVATLMEIFGISPEEFRRRALKLKSDDQ